MPPPDVYFTEAYGRAEETRGSGEWLDLDAFDGLWRMPLHLRRADGFVDGVSPYGYSGLYIHADLTSHDRRLAWDRAVRELRERDALSVFIRQSPLVGASIDSSDFRTVVDGHQTVCVDVTDASVAWTRMEGRSRTSIRKAERLRLAVTVDRASLADVADNSPFRTLYEAAMRRRNAGESYFFPQEYYESLVLGLGENLLLASVKDEAGTLVSGALLMRHGSLLHYHLSGALPEAGRDGATNLMLWGAIQWASQHGLERFHLGGGVTNGDSLFKFKRSLGGHVLTYSAYGAVVDPVGYERAVSQRSAQLGRAVQDLDEKYFPQFRIHP